MLRTLALARANDQLAFDERAPVSQTPYPELNTAALLALSKWKFSPGTLDGQPTDVIFNLTVNFRLN